MRRLNSSGVVIVETMAAWLVVGFFGLIFVGAAVVGLNHCATGSCELYGSNLRDYSEIQIALGNFPEHEDK